MSDNPSLALPLSVRIGRWWFQRRGVSPLPLIGVCLLLPSQAALSPLQAGLIGLGVFLAESVRIWAVGYAGSVTRTRGDTVGRLVHAGPFRFVRNPLYLANTLLYTLFALAFGFTSIALLVALYFAVQYSFIVAFEESRLREEYSVAYEFYCARVPRWLPAFSPQVDSSDHLFSLPAALRSERATLVAIAVMLGLAVAKHALS
jgi:protein-S-isoprenylcysteine O-methyltransferase Ste14